MIACANRFFNVSNKMFILLRYFKVRQNAKKIKHIFYFLFQGCRWNPFFVFVEE